MMHIDGCKVVSANEIARVEKEAFQEGIKEEELMLHAAEQVASYAWEYLQHHKTKQQVTLLVGKGNNGADAYVAGRILIQKGCTVQAIHLFSFESCSHLNRLNCDKFRKEGGNVLFITDEDEIVMPTEGILIDGLLGTGFKKEVKGLLLDVINKANKSKLPVFSIDIPSGLNGNNGRVGSGAIEAYQTICFTLPKTGFFLNDGWNYVGKLKCVDIGLPEKYIDKSQYDFIMPEHNQLCQLLPPITIKQHKYEAGYVVGIAGAKGMTGAAKLSSLSSLRSGAGIVKLFVPKESEDQIYSCAWEVIVDYLDCNTLSNVLEACRKAKAIYLGPGLGRSKEINQQINQILSQLKKPVVLDAEALLCKKENIFPGSILTPHRKEMMRLLSLEKNEDEEAFLMQCKDFSNQYQVVLILKGAPTFIFYKNKTYVLPYGNPGMATAGSGDVLTGMIAALLSKEMDSLEAALLGVYLHEIAGSKAAEKKTQYSMIASDIIENIPEAFNYAIQSE